MARRYGGFSCYACSAIIETKADDGYMGDAAQEAGRHGWVIGHFDGQGHVACPNCAPKLHDAVLMHRRTELR